MKIVNLKVADLVLDPELYPRHQVDSTVVRRFADAMQAGAEFPPIKVSAEGNVVVDGRHRLAAWRRVHGDDAEIPALVVKYESRLDLFEEAVRTNSAHGTVLTPFDQALCVTRFRELGADEGRIRRVLTLTETAYGDLIRRKLALRDGKSVPLKRTLQHLAGKELSTAQADLNVRAGGLKPTHYINQLIDLLESDGLDFTNEIVVDKLRRLAELLEAKLCSGAMK